MDETWRSVRSYLGDAGYAPTNCGLTPYRRVRHPSHLQELAIGDQRLQNNEELFNLRHSSLRNIIERIFRNAN